jgi:hypothetical protein
MLLAGNFINNFSKESSEVEELVLQMLEKPAKQANQVL